MSSTQIRVRGRIAFRVEKQIFWETKVREEVAGRSELGTACAFSEEGYASS